MTVATTCAGTLCSLAAQAAPSGGGTSTPWAEYGLAGLCLAAVAVFANRSINREREQHDVIVAALRAENDAERARHEKDEARIIAQRDSMIDDFFERALPTLQRSSEVLEKRQVLDERTLQLLEQVRALLGARDP